MSLYLVVHHQQDPKQNWSNSWLDDERLESITAPASLGRLCLDAMENGEHVFIHRCGWGDIHPAICCSVIVVKIAAIDHETSLVMFGEQQVLRAQPPFSPNPGQNYYRA